MLRKMICLAALVLIVVLCVGSAAAIDIQDPILVEHVSPVAAYAHSPDSGGSRATERIFNRILDETGAMWEPAVPPAVVYIIFDMGEPFLFEQFHWWNRPTSGNLAAENVDFYRFAGDVPKDSYDIEGDGDLIALDQDVVLGLEQPGNRDNDDVTREDIAFSSPFTARYIGLRFNDGQQSGHDNIQMNEIAFGGTSLLKARDPDPCDGAIGVPQNPTLQWTAGELASGHDVYFGDNFADVNDANKALPAYKTTKSLGDETYVTGTLDLGETYYWRIDEVNGSNTWPGNVWEFTVVPPDPPYGLDRGHWLFLNWGLQIQALAGQVIGNLSMARWDESNFTAVYASGSIGPGSTITTGRAWGAYGPGADAIYNAESRSRMINAQFRDEQGIDNPTEVDDAAYALGRWRLRFPNAVGCTNQARNEANNSEMRTYMQAAHPDMLCFDWYPFYSNNVVGGSPTNWYEPLGRYRMLGLEGNNGASTKPIPTGTWLQTWIKDGHVISESELRLNQFATWAYGYKFAAVFFYNRSGVFGGSMETSLFENIGINGGENDHNPTPTFYQMAETNRQSRNLGPTLVRLLTTDIRFVRGQYKWLSWTFDNPVPGYASEWSSGADPYITSISVTTSPPGINDGLRGDVLVGYFKPLLERLDGPVYSNQMYFMIVNGLSDPDGNAVETQQDIRINFSGITSLQRLSRDTGQVEVVPLNPTGGYHLDLTLDGGTGDLFKFNTGAPFIVGRPSDFDFDNDVDAADLQVLTDYWVDDTCNWSFWCEHTDLDQSGTVDVVDFAIAALSWMEGAQ